MAAQVPVSSPPAACYAVKIACGCKQSWGERMNKLARIFLCGAAVWVAAGCAARTIIPAPKEGVTTTVSECDKTPNCGQCVSNGRCGWCAASGRCLLIDAAQSCANGWIPKDPEQTLCSAAPPSSAGAATQGPAQGNSQSP